MRLIDAEKLEVFAETVPNGMDVDSFIEGMGVVMDRIAKAPTVDAVEVVRCEECKEWAKTIGDEGFSIGRCELLGRDLVMNKGFCAWGVRKDDAN